MKRYYRILFIALILFIDQQYIYSQKILYFKDFDYFTMTGISNLSGTAESPNFYVKCTFDNNNNLTEICSALKPIGDHYSLEHCIPVIIHLGRKMLYLGSGKTRQGYTRTLFQKQIFESDTAIILSDTIIFKRTSEKYYKVQVYTKKNNDSIGFREMTYFINKTTKPKLRSLKTFSRYNEWFALDQFAEQIVDGVINPKADLILKFRKIKSNYFFNRIDIFKNSLNARSTMPVSLFWLKTSGLLY